MDGRLYQSRTNGSIGSTYCNWYVEEYSDLDAYTRAAIDTRLLGLEQVDLMLLHWPCSTMEDTVRSWRALEAFQLAGKAKYPLYTFEGLLPLYQASLPSAIVAHQEGGQLVI